MSRNTQMSTSRRTLVQCTYWLSTLVRIIDTSLELGHSVSVLKFIFGVTLRFDGKGYMTLYIQTQTNTCNIVVTTAWIVCLQSLQKSIGEIIWWCLIKWIINCWLNVQIHTTMLSCTNYIQYFIICVCCNFL